MYLKGENISYDSLWFKEEKRTGLQVRKAETTKGINTMCCYKIVLLDVMYFLKYKNGLRNNTYVCKYSVIMSIFME